MGFPKLIAARNRKRLETRKGVEQLIAELRGKAGNAKIDEQESAEVLREAQAAAQQKDAEQKAKSRETLQAPPEAQVPPPVPVQPPGAPPTGGGAGGLSSAASGILSLVNGGRGVQQQGGGAAGGDQPAVAPPPGVPTGQAQGSLQPRASGDAQQFLDLASLLSGNQGIAQRRAEPTASQVNSEQVALDNLLTNEATNLAPLIRAAQEAEQSGSPGREKKAKNAVLKASQALQERVGSRNQVSVFQRAKEFVVTGDDVAKKRQLDLKNSGLRNRKLTLDIRNAEDKRAAQQKADKLAKDSFDVRAWGVAAEDMSSSEKTSLINSLTEDNGLLKPGQEANLDRAQRVSFRDGELLLHVSEDLFFRPDTGKLEKVSFSEVNDLLSTWDSDSKSRDRIAELGLGGPKLVKGPDGEPVREFAPIFETDPDHLNALPMRGLWSINQQDQAAASKGVKIAKPPKPKVKPVVKAPAKPAAPDTRTSRERGRERGAAISGGISGGITDVIGAGAQAAQATTRGLSAAAKDVFGSEARRERLSGIGQITERQKEQKRKAKEERELLLGILQGLTSQ